tara:strand:+ start:244 stop:879 length:636 start_codon:yes stop_codon:yes gene_type:complete
MGVIGISLLQFLDPQILTAITVLTIVIVNIPTLLEYANNEPRVKLDINKDQISDDMFYNSKIGALLERLKPFKKYNKVSYKTGVKYMRKFFKTVKILEYDNLYNRNQYYELCNDYLKDAINHFQSISVSMPERDKINAIKLGDFESTKKTNELSVIIKELNNECYYILLNIGYVFNKKWSESPNVYTKEIDLNTDRIESYSIDDEVNWKLY